jgi:hypothetical protein
MFASEHENANVRVARLAQFGPQPLDLVSKKQRTMEIAIAIRIDRWTARPFQLFVATFGENCLRQGRHIEMWETMIYASSNGEFSSKW